MLDELFTATAGGPALLEAKGLHGRLLQTSNVDQLQDALLSMDWPIDSDLRQKMMEVTNTFGHEVNVFRSFGSATLAMAWVAAGRLDGYLNYQFKAWDVAAAGLLVKQAGGVVCDIDGQPMELVASNMSGLLTNGHLAQYLSLEK
jgi:myo-inositol-1(or 4)-monophosphatase